jgi:hypothetical protein
VYAPVSSYDALRKVLDDKLAEYNETNTVGVAGGGKRRGRTGWPGRVGASGLLRPAALAKTQTP